jgi:serine/threonine-protein kinase RsbW
VNSNLDEIESILSWFEQLHDPLLPSTLWMQAKLALVEAFTNAVRHAHAPLLPPPDVTLLVELASDVFSVEIIDRGESFDLDAAFRRLEEELEGSDYDPLAREAHWGLVMLLNLRREHGWRIGYRRLQDGSNCLSMSHLIDPDWTADTSC